jgi:hypothetical protein
MRKKRHLSDRLPDSPRLRLDFNTEVLPIEKILTHSENEYGPLASIHQAYGLLFEELDEFWDEVRLKRRRRSAAHIREELFQLAAQAIKTARYAGTFVGRERDNAGHLKD